MDALLYRARVDDGTVDGESKRRLGSAGRCCVGDEGLQDVVDDGLVPVLGLGVVVGCSVSERCVACLGDDLFEPLLRCGHVRRGGRPDRWGGRHGCWWR